MLHWVVAILVCIGLRLKFVRRGLKTADVDVETATGCTISGRTVWNVINSVGRLAVGKYRSRKQAYLEVHFKDRGDEEPATFSFL